MKHSDRLALAEADRNIATAKRHIARQRLILGRLRRAGHPTEVAEDTLEAMQSSLAIFERHRARLIR